MLNKITGRYGVGAQVASFVEEAERMIGEYGWQDRTVSPYMHAEPLVKYIGWLKEYDRCTRGSKEHLVLLANGLADVMNAWEEHEKAATVKCRLLRGEHVGETRMYEPWMADMLVEDGAVEIIEEVR